MHETTSNNIQWANIPDKWIDSQFRPRKDYDPNVEAYKMMRDRIVAENQLKLAP